MGNLLFNYITPIGWMARRLLKGPFSLFEDAHTKEDYIAVFNAWEAEVEAIVPAEKLLKVRRSAAG